jgi:hypothetical protein
LLPLLPINVGASYVTGFHSNVFLVRNNTVGFEMTRS